MSGDLPIDNLKHLGALRAALYYSQRLVPITSVRRTISRLAAGAIRATHRTPRRLQDAGAVGPEQTYVKALHRDGWTRLPSLLSGNEMADILGYLKDKELVAQDGRRFFADSAPSDVHMGSYPVSTVLKCPKVIDLMNRKEVLDIAREYLGCVPTISGLRIDWSRAGKEKGYVQNFHRDYDDWRFLKLFTYLTDVDDRTGPHEYVAGSHRGNGQFRATLYDENQLKERYGANNLVRVHGERGTMFMVDTWGIHRGNAPETGARMLMQIQYSIMPVLKFDYQPVPLQLPAQFSRYTNRLLIAEHGSVSTPSTHQPA
jgi:Phytanoyl-CoA dioxygenase (PhyH)